MKKVITYGTFDLFHNGHYNILARAKEYGDYLIVGVTGDTYDIGRGKLSVKDSLAERIENVRKTGLADEIIVEEYLGQKISDINKYDIDTFVIGDDWKGKFDHISRYCNLVYLERTKGISSTKLRNETCQQYNIGIITDQTDDNQLVKEAGLVNGFNVTGVYSESRTIADAFAEKYGLAKVYYSTEEMFKDIQIVHVGVSLDQRYEYIKYALKSGKHVIGESPFTLESDKQRELTELAVSKGLVLINNIKLIYIQVFTQLLWICHSGMLGDIIRVECSVSKQNMDIPYLFNELMAMSICPVIKILGTEFDEMKCKTIKNDSKVEFGSINLKYGDCDAIINVGETVRVNNKIEIIGSKGTIRMGDNWWTAKYFELYKTDGSPKQVYNVNFSGNGFRFLILEMMNMISDRRSTSKILTVDESVRIIEILEAFYKVTSCHETSSSNC